MEFDVKKAVTGVVTGAGIGLATFFAAGIEPPSNPLKAFEPIIGADGPEVKGAPVDNVISSGPKGP